MWVKMAWEDNRICVQKKNTTDIGVFPTSINTNPNITTIGNVDVDIVQHIWTPQVMIPHKKLQSCQHGPPLHDKVVNIVEKNGDVWVDYWTLLKITTTCPLTFNWYPFDVQNCPLFIQVCQPKFLCLVGFTGFTDFSTLNTPEQHFQRSK